MGFSIVLENERGEAIATLEDPVNLLHKILPSPDDKGFHYLNQIDWYGDTTFNRLQLTGLRLELLQLKNTVTLPDAIALLTQLDELAARSQVEPHLYMKFYGD
jgi:hypothetical protein